MMKPLDAPMDGDMGEPVDVVTVGESMGAVRADGLVRYGTTARLSIAGTEDYTHFSAWTASTAGTFLFSGTITANAVTIGDTFTIPVGDLDVSLAIAS